MPLTSREIRKSFFDFFAQRGHSYVASSSLVIKDDPTLLFANAGMNQFKAVFLGDNRSAYKRVYNSQKCLRVSGKHNDLDEVGRDGHHHTFFEMLGNWSFGDYGKEEAIQWAWKLLTEVWKLPVERLFVTVHPDDHESAAIWRDKVGVASDRILKFSEENFWEMGAVGPCGPSTEIMYDTGDLKTQAESFCDPVAGINGQNERYIEIWNLVFIQYERLQDNTLRQLPQLHVDTGSGFERICAVIQKKSSNYDTDVFKPIIDAIASETGVAYRPDADGIPHRVIADHLRAVAFAIADGVSPGNEGRGYVIRRILRRACRYSHLLGHKGPLLCKLVKLLSTMMADVFPALSEQEDYIAQVIKAEEKRFLKTLSHGMDRLDKLMSANKDQTQKKIAGKDLFLLHDTYGFPVDLTEIIANERGFAVDLDGYRRYMSEQKDRARSHAKFSATLGQDEAWTVLSPGRDTDFVGYDTLEVQAAVTRVREDGDDIYVCLDKTPFYAEAGGQIGDSGLLCGNDIELRVEDTVKGFGLHIHRCRLISGLVNPNALQSLNAKVDIEKRFRIARHHSVTHLLHAALKEVLGNRVAQKGSWVGPDRLRFDFAFHRRLSTDEIESIEDIVNRQIQENVAIKTELMPLEEAKRSGAVALFGEAYSDPVRVLTMGDFSKELCGGTHAAATGDIGSFVILSEVSIAAGIRRIEAMASIAAFEYLRAQRETITALGKQLKCAPGGVLARVHELQEKKLAGEKELGVLRSRQRQALLNELLATKQSHNSLGYIVAQLDELSAEELSALAVDMLNSLNQLPELAVLCKSEGEGSRLIVVVGAPLQGQIKANEIAKKIFTELGGRGGGRADRAQGVIPKPITQKQLADLVVRIL